MATIAVKDKYAEVLTTLGDLQTAVDLALQRYTIEQITTKIDELKRREAIYQDKYGLEYPTFAQSISKDETFINHIETNVSKQWEIDLADWEFCHKGIKDWTQQLQTLLLT
ncbi:MAG: hypothetical protein JW953_02485 [Anaerolineae bacterium]|nr:hypothetical protein [Anaerolineae bacterium]